MMEWHEIGTPEIGIEIENSGILEMMGNGFSRI